MARVDFEWANGMHSVLVDIPWTAADLSRRTRVSVADAGGTPSEVRTVLGSRSAVTVVVDVKGHARAYRHVRLDQ